MTASLPSGRQERVAHAWNHAFQERLQYAVAIAENADGGDVNTAMSPVPFRSVVEQVNYRNPTGLTADAANYGVISIQNTAADEVCADWSTEVGQEGTLGVGTEVQLTPGTLADRLIEAGEALQANVTETGTTTVPAGSAEVYLRCVPKSPTFAGVFKALRGDFRLDSVEFALDDGLAADVTDYITARMLNLEPSVVADDVFTATNATNMFTAVAHGLVTGQGPFQVSNSGGALPAGLVAATDYWIIRSDADDFQLATSLANAYAGTAVAISDDGTGTQTIADTASTKKPVIVSSYDTRAANEGALTAGELAAMTLSATIADLVLAADDQLDLVVTGAGDAVLSRISLVLHGRYL